jgi:hypothetical protein
VTDEITWPSDFDEWYKRFDRASKERGQGGTGAYRQELAKAGPIAECRLLQLAFTYCHPSHDPIRNWRRAQRRAENAAFKLADQIDSLRGELALAQTKPLLETIFANPRYRQLIPIMRDLARLLREIVPPTARREGSLRKPTRQYLLVKIEATLRQIGAKNVYQTLGVLLEDASDAHGKAKDYPAHNLRQIVTRMKLYHPELVTTIRMGAAAEVESGRLMADALTERIIADLFSEGQPSKRSLSDLRRPTRVAPEWPAEKVRSRRRS